MSSPSDGRRGARILVPSGMLGSGFPEATVARGVALGVDAIAVDGGSTDSGPHYLGTGQAKSAAAAVRRDLDVLVRAAHAANVPLIVGSCGTSGADTGVDWVHGLVVEVLDEARISTTVARIYSEQDRSRMVAAVEAGRVKPLPPAAPLAMADLERCGRIVGLMGHEPIADALEAGARIVLAGRATDTAVIAAIPLMRGAAPGAAWHAAKVAECGGLCTTSPTSGGVLVDVDDSGFTIEPLDESAACTTTSVAAHLLYENADPFRMREPAGTLLTENASYRALDERRVRVEGSRFESAEQHTIKLEGAALAGFETMSLVGVRDPDVLASIDVWTENLEKHVHRRISSLLDLPPDDYEIAFRYFGWTATLGDYDREAKPHEVGLVFRARARDQATASAIAKIANPVLLHFPLPGTTALPSFAFLTSPAEVERGAVYEFVLQHAVDVNSPTELFRTEIEEIA